MLKIDLINEEPLVQSLDVLISGLLPHENYNPAMFGKIMERIFAYVPLDEMEMEYYVLMSPLVQMRQMQSHIENFIPKFERSIFESILESKIFEIVRMPKVGMRRWLSANGIPDNITGDGNERNLEVAANKLYERSMDLYDRCYDMAKSSDDVLSILPSFKASYENAVFNVAMKAQREIVETGLQQGRKFYYGPGGWREFMGKLIFDLGKRLDDGDIVSEELHLNTLEDSMRLLKEFTAFLEPIVTFKDEPLNQKIAILKHRLITIAANPNAGKTILSIHMTAMLILHKKKVLFMFGESPMGSIYTMIISSYIFQKYGKFIPPNIIAMVDEVEDQETAAIIRNSILEVVEGGCLYMKGSFGYYTVYQELADIYQEFPFDAGFFDHSRAFTGSRGKEREDIDALSVSLRMFKKRYPVFLCVLSHLSTMAKELLSKGKRVTDNPTRGSSTLYSESDESYVMYTNEKLEKRYISILDLIKKRNDLDKGPVALQLKPEVGAVIYDASLQSVVQNDFVASEAALEQIKDLYASQEAEEEDYYFEDVDAS